MYLGSIGGEMGDDRDPVTPPTGDLVCRPTQSQRLSEVTSPE